ncbi:MULTISPECIES: flagellar hook-basal body protein [Paenibacillus]|uniref:Flagellar hook-basal body complex protein FlhO n=1 Tax=Paenibacillus azoreducens TaxID=116718 RepID=A0A919YEA1_9BACL|nr:MULTISPECIES: flagellar hook-basal body protein [Paenibacillus]MBE9916767.1 flagellar hook-basal body protein [Paenibacillus donghaensis]GIO48869.1 flagellar hook-basal body complex protein FlhO [Paenibacillus azoreducens]
MIRGLYTAAAGMMTQESRHDTAVQNLANVNTPGYKQVNSVARSFPEMLLRMVGGNSEVPEPRIGKLSTGVFAEEALSIYKQGVVTESAKPTDFALVSDMEMNDPATGQPIKFDGSGKYISANGDAIYKPEAFFTVQGQDGQIRYTKDGSFKVDTTGRLLTSTGYQVLDSNNRPIVLTGPVDSLKVDEQGYIRNPDTGARGARLGVSVVAQPYQMVRDGEGVFRIDDPRGAGVRAMGGTDRVEVRQNYIETSNVNPSDVVVDMNMALRAYEANQKVIQFYDKSLDKAVNEVGKV